MSHPDDREQARALQQQEDSEVVLRLPHPGTTTSRTNNEMSAMSAYDERGQGPNLVPGDHGPIEPRDGDSLTGAQGDPEILIEGLPPISREAPTSPTWSYVDELAGLGLDVEPSRPSTPQDGAEGLTRPKVVQRPSDATRSPSSPAEDWEQEMCSPPPAYRRHDEISWVTQGRGGGGPEGFSMDQRDLSHWVRLGAGGRPVGAATQVQEDGRTSPERRALFTLSPPQEACRVEPRAATPYGPPMTDQAMALHNLSVLTGELRLSLRDLEGRVAAETALRLDANNRLMRIEERAIRMELEAQQTEARRRALEEELRRETIARQELTNHLAIEAEANRQLQVQLAQQQAHFQAHLADETANWQRLEDRVTMTDRCLTTLEGVCRDGISTLQGTVEGLSQLTTTLPPLAASTPNRRDDSSGVGTQDDSSTNWSHEATAGTSTAEDSPELMSGPEDSIRSPPARAVHFQDEAAPTPEVVAPISRATGGKPNRQVPALSHFSGKKGESLREFMEKMRLAAQMGNWDPRHHLLTIRYQLQGQALQYVNNLPPDRVDTLPKLEMVLKERYESKGVRKDAKEELRIIRRRAAENPEAFGLRIQGLTRLAYPEDSAAQEEEGVSAFLRGIADQKTAETMISGQFSTVQQCINTLTEIERHRDSVGRNQTILKIRQVEEQRQEPQPKSKAKGPSTQAASAQVAAVTQEPSPKEKELEQELANVKRKFTKQLADMQRQLSRVSDREQRQPRPARVEYPSQEQPCRFCGSPDHWQWRCPERANQSGPERRPGNDHGLDPRSGGQSHE